MTMTTASGVIASEPRAALRRAAIVAAFAALIVAVGTATIIAADGSAWIVYLLALVVIALSVMQVVTPGAGVRVPRLQRSRTRDAGEALEAALAEAFLTRRERTMPLFGDVGERDDSIEAYERSSAAYHRAAAERRQRDEAAHATRRETFEYGDVEYSVLIGRVAMEAALSVFDYLDEEEVARIMRRTKAKLEASRSEADVS